jgi:rfaE bifunctional protein nucleotidyltransferase chain/domain
MDNFLGQDELKEICTRLKKEGKKIVFTNGCFDILHAGHIDYLTKAKTLGDILVVGVNSDKSVRVIKGGRRPIIPEQERALIISNLKPVDYVTLFDEPTPRELIELLIPDILVKGADWDLEKIVGRDVVEANGGKVLTINFVNDQSTTKIIKTILGRFKDG